LEQQLAELFAKRDAGETFLAANPGHAEGLKAYWRYTGELLDLCTGNEAVAWAVYQSRQVVEQGELM
jgi:hypothetical protein